nr:MAG TPA: hypothetical protein [Caudoviricetes sp.]
MSGLSLRAASPIYFSVLITYLLFLHKDIYIGNILLVPYKIPYES